MTEHVETAIIGGGQAGLATGYHLGRLGRSFLILDAQDRTGDSWRKRWDSLQLFTPAYRLFTPPFWFFISRVASVTNPVGRRMRPQMIKTTLALGRVKPKDLDAAGVLRLPRTVTAREGRPVMEDGRVIDVSNLVWCTGYRSTFDWVQLDVFDQEGRPVHDRGTTAEPGLYFIGLFFLSSLASSLVGGVGRDAAYIARHIAARRPSTWAVPRALRHAQGA